MSSIRRSIARLGKSQEGVVSLLVTMVLMIVISLIALGFAQVARRNQGQELNQQLSTQAFYAAESGINDAAQIFSTELGAGVPATNLSRTTCNAGGFSNVYIPLNSGSLGTVADNVAYTCVLINPTPGDIKTNIGTTSKIIPINSTSTITSINLNWSTLSASATPTNGCSNTVQLPTAAAWGACDVGVLRVDLVPTDYADGAPVPSNPTTFAKQTLSFFVVPITTGPPNQTIPYNGATASTNNNDNIIGTHCKNVNPNCQIKIDTSGFPYKSYEMRVSSEYEDSSLDIQANGGAAPLTGAQVVIDATGKAQNVVRRVQVYVPVGVMSNQLSDYAIESTDSICKRYVVMNGYYASEMTGVGVTSNNPNPAANPLCQ